MPRRLNCFMLRSFSVPIFKCQKRSKRRFILIKKIYFCSFTWWNLSTWNYIIFKFQRTVKPAWRGHSTIEADVFITQVYEFVHLLYQDRTPKTYGHACGRECSGHVNIHYKIFASVFNIYTMALVPDRPMINAGTTFAQSLEKCCKL